MLLPPPFNDRRFFARKFVNNFQFTTPSHYADDTQKNDIMQKNTYVNDIQQNNTKMNGIKQNDTLWKLALLPRVLLNTVSY